MSIKYVFILIQFENYISYVYIITYYAQIVQIGIIDNNNVVLKH